MTRIKLCGLTRECEIACANGLRPEYIGFVFVPGSKRYLPPEQAVKLSCLLAHGITAVGVFVNEHPDVIIALVKQGVISAVQLHGAETDEYIKRLKEAIDCPIIKAFGISALSDAEKANNSAADFILVDSPGGGTGRTFDHTLLKEIHRPYFLAGGLDAENVGEFLSAYHPYAVDVSSGIETNGKKDIKKMKQFVAAVRADIN